MLVANDRSATSICGLTAAAEHFSVRTSYQDDNGNIQTLQRQNLVARNPNAPATYDYVDKLTYAYEGNQLKSVEDDPSLPSNAPASDFKEQSRTNVNATEYSYDPSGKLLSDKNKGANVSITYNDLDLPATIAMASNDYLTNVYAATGDKLQMTVTQNAGVVATYHYIGGIVYLNDVPQFIPTSEGRILSPQVSQTGAWQYEYFYRDHLGDLRVAFRSGGPTRSFTATLDPVDEVAWSNVTAPVRNSEQAFNAGGYSAKLVPANPLGPRKTVKVSKGDVVTVSTVGRYVSTTQPNNSAVSLITYVNGLPAQTPESGNNKAWLSLGLQITPQAVNSSQSGVPKAYLEYLLQTEGDNAVTQSKRVYLTTAALNGWESLTMSYTAETDGYLQVLVANDSDQPVWFDNVSISVQPALITQETHYDPWGLELAGIERRGSPEHRWKFQGKESITDLSLYWQDFGARYYDPQLGRWHVGDPADQFGSPYLGLGNNPLNGTDPDGRWFGVDDLIVAGIGFIGGYVGHGLTTGNWGGDALASGAITAGASWLTYNTAGLATSYFAKAGLSKAAASVLGSGVGQAVGGAFSSISGQAYFNNGNIDFGAVGKSALYGFGSGIAGGLVDISPLMNMKFAMHHTIKHIVRSTVSQAGGNLILGQNPIEDNSFGLDPSIMFPMVLDAATLTSRYWARPLTEKMVDKYKDKLKENAGIDKVHVNKFSSFDIYSDSKGSLRVLIKGLDVNVSGSTTFGRIKVNVDNLGISANRFQVSLTGRYYRGILHTHNQSISF